MKKIRINELARELEVKAHEILDRLPELGVTEKKTHSSSIDEDVAIKLRRLYGFDVAGSGSRSGAGAGRERAIAHEEHAAGRRPGSAGSAPSERHPKPATEAAPERAAGRCRAGPRDRGSEAGDARRPALPIRPPLAGRPIHPPVVGTSAHRRRSLPLRPPRRPRRRNPLRPPPRPRPPPARHAAGGRDCAGPARRRRLPSPCRGPATPRRGPARFSPDRASRCPSGFGSAVASASRRDPLRRHAAAAASSSAPPGRSACRGAHARLPARRDAPAASSRSVAGRSPDSPRRVR